MSTTTSSDLSAIARYADGLLASLRPTQRRELAAEIAREMRQVNSRRITAQRAPDGSAFAPRAQPLRQRKKSGTGTIRARNQAMFRKLRTAAWLKTKASPEQATVHFAGGAARLAKVHHFGLSDVVDPKRPSIRHKYTARPLLGFDEADRQRITQAVISHLASAAK